jgi:hypothetical protein
LYPLCIDYKSGKWDGKLDVKIDANLNELDPTDIFYSLPEDALLDVN